jgi:hypothetical protein
MREEITSGKAESQTFNLGTKFRYIPSVGLSSCEITTLNSLDHMIFQGTVSLLKWELQESIGALSAQGDKCSRDLLFANST